ncbi:hypothetical protein DICVIV_00438 [Dictyocaulus viviparus]|uniref:Uncharacterized protein n=1 Tax=Dictyocaulus viviparus TaxID=29172 RepID=A0A0D8Y9B1_DICVI|nr:hypothetical protein DICVIV_00438 [Dictyocaulus viviparus]
MTAFSTAAQGVVDSNKALLFALSPIGQPLQEINIGDYYVLALSYLHNHHHSEEVIKMARCAISALPPGHECTSRIYVTLFNHLVNQENWCDALSSIFQNTARFLSLYISAVSFDMEVKRMTLRELISRMLHVQDWKSIVELKYGKLEEEAENILLTAARTQEATASPHLFKLMFSFYMKRNDFESAARAQYEYAFVLRTQTEQTPEILRRRRDALAVASTLLDLLPKVDRFLSFPQELTEEEDHGDSEETSMDITQEMIDVAMVDVIADELNIVPPHRTTVRRRMFILTADMLCEEWVIANARMALLPSGKVPPSEPKEIVHDLISVRNYDLAFDVCRHCDVSVNDLLYAVTRESIMIDADPTDIPPAWIQFNQRYSEDQGPRDHWSIVRGMVAHAQRLWPNDSRIMKAVTRAFLSHKLPVPYWLEKEFVMRDIGSYLRCLIEYGAISDGLKIAADCVDDETKKIKSIDSRVWLPLTCINDLLNLKITESEMPLLSALHDKLNVYFKRIQSFETAAKLSN